MEDSVLDERLARRLETEPAIEALNRDLGMEEGAPGPRLPRPIDGGEHEFPPEPGAAGRFAHRDPLDLGQGAVVNHPDPERPDRMPPEPGEEMAGSSVEAIDLGSLIHPLLVDEDLHPKGDGFPEFGFAPGVAN